jgi:hypothetical protein
MYVTLRAATSLSTRTTPAIAGSFFGQDLPLSSLHEKPAKPGPVSPQNDGYRMIVSRLLKDTDMTLQAWIFPTASLSMTVSH